MTVQISPDSFDINVHLRRFVQSCLPEDVEVIKGQDNRVPQPKGPDYCVFWPIRQERLETNWDYYVDCTFIGTIRGHELRVEKVGLGTPTQTSLEARIKKLKWMIAHAHLVLTRIEHGDFSPDTEVYEDEPLSMLPTPMTDRKLFGVGLDWETRIVKAHEKHKNTYHLNKPYQLGPQLFAAGVAYIFQHMQSVYQLDVYGPRSEENVAIISTLFRDPYGVANYQGWPKQDSLYPLYTSDPRMLPFINQESQYERRWIIDLHMQANMMVHNVPQQFAERLQLLITKVEDYGHRNSIAVPPPVMLRDPTLGDEVMKLEHLLSELHKKINVLAAGTF